MNNWKIVKNADFTYIKLCFLGFCILAMQGNKSAFEIASLMIEMILNKSRDEVYEECDDEYLIQNIDKFDDSYFDYLSLPYFPLPSDSIDIIQSYKKVIETTDMYETLPTDLKQYIEVNFLNQSKI